MPEKTPIPDAVKSINIPSYDELLARIRDRSVGKKGARKCLARLERTYNILASKTSPVEHLYELFKSMDSFYLDLLSSEFSLEEVKKAFSCIFKARKLSRKFWDAYRYKILASESNREACSISKEGVGRILSLYKRCRKSLLLLKNIVVYLSRLPSIDPEAPIIIVAGAPNAGKSSFVRAVSTGKPEVASYPFTTKNVTLGHRVVRGFKVQFIDTPGLLDRPIEEMNQIERRAVAALTRLNGSILFLLDPTPSSHLDLKSQRNLLANVSRLTRGKPLFIGINKCDIADQALLEACRSIAKEFIESGLAVKYYELSALNKELAEAVAEDISINTLKLLGFLS